MKYTLGLTLLILQTGIFIQHELVAWERSAYKLCSKNERICLRNAQLCSESYSICKKQEQKCRENAQMCLETNRINDELSFSSLLNTYYFDQFNAFSPGQKKKAMDYADNGAMTPNDAVAEVLAIPHEIE